MRRAELSKKLVEISRSLAKQVTQIQFLEPVACVYNPLLYAKEPWENYVKKYSRPRVPAILLGMNPGPFGMAQTGVPFGEVQAVSGWLGIKGKITRPKKQHPKRPVWGFQCPKSEVSGRRVWTWAQETFGNPDEFFKKFFVLNYCPLVFMEESGKNRTPDKLPAKKKKELFSICDHALRSSIEIIRPEFVIGVGAFAESRITAALYGMDIKTGRILHPSPANPQANKGWASQAQRELEKIGINLGPP